jgi:hypothetical protein
MSSADESNNSDTSSDASSIIYQLAGVAAVVGAYAAVTYIPGPVVNSDLELQPMTGWQWVELNLRNAGRCHDNFHMSSDAFLQLHDTLVTYHGLRSTQEVDTIESLAMFVWACASRQACRQIKDRFERSLDTICRKMSEVVDVMFSFAETIIAPKDPTYKK